MPVKHWIFSIALALLLGCASAGSSGPNNSEDGSNSAGTAGRRLLVFRLSVNPNATIDRSGQGYYVILLNANGQAIEATDLDTFTDFIRFDGTNFDWFHRQANQPNPGFNFVQVGSLNSAATISPDGKTIEVVLDIGESTNFLNQFIVGNTFTAHAMTSDNFQGGLIGRLIDTLGQGPNINSNSAQTITVRKGDGAITPLPQSYPIDPINDFITQGGLPVNFPTLNFDIARFEVVAI